MKRGAAIKWFEPLRYKPSPQTRANNARSDIYTLTVGIDHHAGVASALRKDRQRAQAKLDRALKAGAK